MACSDSPKYENHKGKNADHTDYAPALLTARILE
jgi:hypothetical protein